MKLTPEEGLSSSRAVFAGEVTNIAKNEQTPFGGLEVTLRVKKVWKGALVEEVKVRTAGSSAACGYPFALGKTYLVYVVADEADPMRVSLCSRTALFEDAKEDLDFLGLPSDDFEKKTAEGSKAGTEKKGRCSASLPADDPSSLPVSILFVAGLMLGVRRLA